MQISSFPHHIFWSYKPDADLPEELVAEQVILFGDIEDIFLLPRLISREKIEQVNRKIESTGEWPKRTNFIDKIILNK